MQERQEGKTGTVLRAILIATLTCLLLPAIAPAQMELVPGAPVEHFRIYGFDKANGWRSWQLEGAQAEITQNGSIKVDMLKLRVYESDSSQTVNLTIESPLAVMDRARDLVGGPGTIVVTARGIFLGGENWTWSPTDKTLRIRTKTHAVLDGELCPVLE